MMCMQALCLLCCSAAYQVTRAVCNTCNMRITGVLVVLHTLLYASGNACIGVPG